MLSITEIRTLIRAHNKLSKITIPAGAKRDDLIKLLSDKGYSINHKLKLIVKPGKPSLITLKKAKKITEPVKKTDEQKATVVSKKKEKEEKKKEETKAVVKQAKKEAVKEFKEKKKAAQKAPKKKVAPPVKKETPPASGPKKVKGAKAKNEALRQKLIASNKKKAVPKGSHKMPDGSIMKNKDMPKKPQRKVLKETQKPSGSDVVQPGKPADLKIESKKDATEEKKAKNVERVKVVEIRKGINRIKDVGYLRDIINQWNSSPPGKKLEKSRGAPLKTTDAITILRNKIILYKMYDIIDIKIPEITRRKKLTDEERAAKKVAAAAQAKVDRDKSKIESPVRTLVNKLYVEFLKRKVEGEDGKELADELEEQWDDSYDEFDDVFEDDDDFFEEMDGFISKLKNKLKSNEPSLTMKEISVWRKANYGKE